MTVRSVLIVDDDVAVTNYLMVFLMQSEIYEPTVLNDSREVAPLLEQEEFDVILLDMDMPNLSGIDVLKAIREGGDETPVIVLSGVNDVDLAVKALKLGAYDYLTKPVDDEYLLEVMAKAVRYGTLQDNIKEMPDQLSRDDLAHEEAFARLPTQNPEMIHLLHRVEKIALGEGRVFIMGGRGTGKGKVAEAIHQASPRKDGPFIALNAAAHDPEELAAVLFGQAAGWKGDHEDVPGMVERAEGGTLYISNIESLPSAVQHRLDRLIRTGEYYPEGTTRTRTADVRVIGGSTRDLRSDAYREVFSRDLLYHLWVNLIELPLLRDRADDIPLLAEHYLRRESARVGVPLEGIDDELAAMLQGYSFPGNLEELKDIVTVCVRNVAEAGGPPDNGLLGVDSLSNYLRDTMLAEKERARNGTITSLAEVVREYVAEAVKGCGGDHERAAMALGISTADVERYLTRPEG